MPVPSQVCRAQRDDDDVPGPRSYLLVAAWADVLLAGFVGLQATHLGDLTGERVFREPDGSARG
ncbi:MAG: hypothetical protein ACRD0Z_11425 [Acidimicrobiales bacterium]